MRYAEAGITELQKFVDTLLIIPNQNLFRVANEKTTFADAFAMADQVLYSGVACITDLMVKEGLINLDFADVRAVMREMGKAMMGTGEASGEKRALRAAEAAISNPLIDDVVDEGRQGPADLDHRRQGPHAVRGRRSRDPHSRGSRQGRQHHRRRDLRRKPRRHHPRLGGGDRHRHAVKADAASAARRRARSAGADRPRPDPPRRSPQPLAAHQLRRRAVPARASSAIEQAATAAVAAAVLPQRRSTTSRSGRCRRSRRCSCDQQPVAAERARACRQASSRRSPSASRSARACRGSTNCRCRRSTRSGRKRGELAGRPSAREAAHERCCSASPRSGSDAARTSEAPADPGMIAPRAGPGAVPPQRPPASAAGAMPAEPVSDYARPRPRRASTRMAGRPLCTILRRGRSTRNPGLPAPPGELTARQLATNDQPGPGFPAGAFVLLARLERHF